MAEHPTDKSRKVDVEPVASSEDSIAHGTVMDADDDLLRHIGYKQSLPLGPLHSLLVARLQRYGVGSPVLSLHCALHFPVSMTIRANAGAVQTEQTVAELVSAYPTSGGMYFVTKQVFPEDKVPLAAWVIGWSNFLGQ
ncbi:polyamine transporter tpo5 [Exophiala xenobiotica]|nr:polyamine transporter tpo5 [Exophiala xenobiotica]